MPTRISQVSSRGKDKWFFKSYSGDFNSGVFSEAQQRNILNLPVENLTSVTDYVDSYQKAVEGRLITYTVNQYGIIVPEKISRFESETDILGDTLIYQGNSIPSVYKPKILFDFFDNHGKLLQYHEKESFPVSFYWGKQGNSGPLAKFEPLQYSYIQNNQCLKDSLDKLDDYNFNDLLIYRENFKALNENIRILLPPGCNATTYTYDNFGNITSITNQNNISTYYEYDALGRLVRVRDQDGKVLKSYTYNYANEY